MISNDMTLCEMQALAASIPHIYTHTYIHIHTQALINNQKSHTHDNVTQANSLILHTHYIHTYIHTYIP